MKLKIHINYSNILSVKEKTIFWKFFSWVRRYLHTFSWPFWTTGWYYTIKRSIFHDFLLHQQKISKNVVLGFKSGQKNNQKFFAYVFTNFFPIAQKWPKSAKNALFMSKKKVFFKTISLGRRFFQKIQSEWNT